jgi:hypothetical protein
MKKFLILLSCCLLPVLAGAQSTCETRVDAHQRATTKQRVAYCLTPDSVAADDTNAGLVFSGVSAHYPSDVQPVDQGGAKAKEGNFEPEQVVIARTYVGTAQFPQVFDDKASEVVEVDNVPAVAGEKQPIKQMEPSTDVPESQQVEMAYVASPTVPVHGSKKPAVAMASSQTQPVTKVPAPVEHFMSDEVGQQNNDHSQAGVVETKKGVLARQTKPARRWVAQDAQPQSSTPSDPYTYQPEDLATPSQPEIPVGTQSYAPAVQTPDQPQDVAAAPISEAILPDTQNGQDEIPVGTSSYAPVTSN